MRVAFGCLRGPEWTPQREDIVAGALGEFVTRICVQPDKTPDVAGAHHANQSDLCNELASPDDLVGVFKTIVRRRAIDFLRHRARRPEVLVADVPETLVDADGGGPDPTALWMKIAKLDPPLPDLFSDRFVLGWNTTEIAERRQMKLNTVLSHFHRGFRALRGRLTP